MEGGKFAIIFVIVVALAGGAAYYAYSSTQDLDARVVRLQTQTANLFAALNDTRNLVNQEYAKVNQLEMSVKQLTDAQAAASTATAAANEAAAKSGGSTPPAASTKTTKR